jgi:predicted N-acetyltransferase YhbS
MSLIVYHSWSEIPPELASQIRASLWREWPGTADEENAGEVIAPDLHPVFFVLAEQEQLRCYARTIWATVSHQGQFFRLYGLGDVLTPPACRRNGFARQVVQAATAQLCADPQADAAILLTGTTLAALYEACGWEPMPALRVACDGRENNDALPMMLFLSTKARAAREGFADNLLLLPGDEW